MSCRDDKDNENLNLTKSSIEIENSNKIIAQIWIMFFLRCDRISRLNFIYLFTYFENGIGIGN